MVLFYNFSAKFMLLTAEKPSDILLKVTLDIISNEECNKLWHTNPKQNILSRGITSSMMCAGALTGGRDTCQVTYLNIYF